MDQVKDKTVIEDRGVEKVEGDLVGSPEIQAKTDGTIKDIEKKIGTTVGEPAKQAIHDGVKTGAASAEE
jgi:hypothetical protein